MPEQESLKQVLVPYETLQAAFAFEQNVENKKEIHIENFNLADTATKVKPRIVEFAFRSFIVITATDTVATASFFPNNRTNLPPDADGIPVNQNFVFRSGVPIQRAEFYWTAQAAKTMRIIFFARSEVIPGNQLTTITELFSSVTDKAMVAASSTRATLIAQNTSRKAFTVYNHGPNTAFVGGSAVESYAAGVGVNVGIPIAMGNAAQMKSSAAWSVICEAAETANLSVQEEG